MGGPHQRRVLRHVDPETLLKTPMSELYWPFGLAALEDEHLAESLDAIVAGRVPAGAFYSKLETRDVGFYFDSGFGFAPDWLVRGGGRGNPHGPFHPRARLEGGDVGGPRI